MKKIFLMMLVFTVVLTGCGKKKDVQEFEFKYVEEESSNDDSEAAESTDAPVEETSGTEVTGTVDSYVSSQYKKDSKVEITFEEDADSYSIEVSYDVPKINDNTEVAEAINAEIYEEAKSSVELVEAILDGSAEEVYEPPFYQIGYEAYLNGDILSILVKYEASYSDWVVYKVYNYNLATKEIAGNDELLEVAGISKDGFISKAKKTFGSLALSDLDDYLNSLSEVENTEGEFLPEDNYRIIADFINSYAETVSEKNITTDMPSYLDSDGNICSVGLVSVPAGAGQYYHTAKLEDVNNAEMFKKYKNYIDEYHFDGFEKACMGFYDVEGYEGSIVRKISLSNMTSEDVYVGFDSDDVSVFTMQFYGPDYSNIYTGSISVDSIDENGVVYAYEFTNKNGEELGVAEEGEESEGIYSGRFYLNPYTKFEENKGDTVSGATYKYIDGDDMFASDGYDVDLRKTFG